MFYNKTNDNQEPVEFDLYQEGNRLLAVNVGANGISLKGSKYAPNTNMNSNSSVPTKVYHRRKMTNN